MSPRAAVAAGVLIGAVLVGAVSGGCTSAPTTTSPGAAGASTSAGTSSPASSPTAAASGWYLALGDSLAAGYQPTTGDQPTRGYAGPVLTAVEADHPGTALHNLGCSGETTASMLGGGRCSYPDGTQLESAVAFLRTHTETVRLVTLDIGANDVLACARPTPDQTCAASTTAAVGRDLTTILGQLRLAAPQADIVVLTYYNPLLAAWRSGTDGQQVATATEPLLDGLNTAIKTAAQGVGAKVADVSGAFSSSQTNASGSSGAAEPVAVQRICAWTWGCTRADIHPNDDGYAVIARAVLAAR